MASADRVRYHRGIVTITPKETPKRNRHGEEIHHFLVRLDRPLNEAVDRRAAEDRCSKADVVRSALRRYVV